MRAERNEVVRTACKRAKMARVERERAGAKKKQTVPSSSADDAGVDSPEICSQDLPELFTTEEAEEKRKSRKEKRVGFDLTRNEERLVPRWDKVYNEAEAQRIAAEEAQRKAEAEERRRRQNSTHDFRPVCRYFLEGRCKFGDRCCRNKHPPNFAPTSANAVPVGVRSSPPRDRERHSRSRTQGTSSTTRPRQMRSSPPRDRERHSRSRTQGTSSTTRPRQMRSSPPRDCEHYSRSRTQGTSSPSRPRQMRSSPPRDRERHSRSRTQDVPSSSRPPQIRSSPPRDHERCSRSRIRGTSSTTRSPTRRFVCEERRLVPYDGIYE